MIDSEVLRRACRKFSSGPSTTMAVFRLLVLASLMCMTFSPAARAQAAFDFLDFSHWWLNDGGPDFAKFFGFYKPFRAKSCDNFVYKPQPGHSLVFSPGTIWHLCEQYTVAFQTDGNLVIYNKKREAIWNTHTNNKNATALAMQEDGNLVIYSDKAPIWSSKTDGHPGAFLAIQLDGNVVIYNKDSPLALWSTHTDRK